MYVEASLELYAKDGGHAIVRSSELSSFVCVVGLTVGVPVAEADDTVGLLLGELDGFDVGLSVGVTVGNFVGLDVGFVMNVKMIEE